MIDLSLVIPLLNEAESLPELQAWIKRVCDDAGLSYEVIFIDDGSKDDSWKIIGQLKDANPEIPTKLYNWATRRMSGIYLHDFNCGLKAYSNEVVKSIEIFGEMHRYIPVIAHREGFKKIGEKVVEHRARKYGTTKFGLERFINGPLDLMTIMFISKFGKRPMHIFGTIGATTFVVGLALTAYLILQKFLHLYVWHTKAPLVADQASFYIALTSMILGTQLFLAGFLGELITRNSATRNQYKIREEI